VDCIPVESDVARWRQSVFRAHHGSYGAATYFDKRMRWRRTRTTDNVAVGTSIANVADLNEWVDPAYDAAGNQTAGPKPGSLDDGETRYWLVYDAWNRLVKVYEDTDADNEFDAGSGDTLLAAYAYDGLHRRVRKTVDPDGADTDYDYYYNTSWQVLEVRKENEDAYPFKQYIWDLRYIDAAVCRIRDADTDGQDLETLYYTTDANMNVTALLEPDGDVVERYGYDAYGRPIILDADWSVDQDQASDYDNEILFAGDRFDSETGYYQVRNRVYDPSLGRWVQRDPLGHVDGVNRYQYVRSAPTRLLDPTGMIGEECKYTGNARVRGTITKHKAVDKVPSFGSSGGDDDIGRGIYDLLKGIHTAATYKKYEKVTYTCECAIKCCDYDWGIKYTTLYMRTPVGLVSMGSEFGTEFGGRHTE